MMSSETDRIHEQILHTEHDITETLHEIENRLSPDHLKEEAVSMLRSRLDTAWNSVQRIMKDNPTPVAIGASILALMMVKSGKSAMSRRTESSPTGGTAMVGAAGPAASGMSTWGIGILGVALGAAIGAMIPVDRKETGLQRDDIGTEPTTASRIAGAGVITKPGLAAREQVGITVK